VYKELKRLSGGTLRQAGLLSRTTASTSCRKSIGLSKVSPDSTLYLKVAEKINVRMWNKSIYDIYDVDSRINIVGKELFHIEIKTEIMI
jgi:hypothetical protein